MTAYPSLNGIPDIRWDPIPHLILPPPHQAYCLTPIWPTDDQVAGATLNHEAVRTTFGTEYMSDEEVHKWLDKRRDSEHVCLEIPVIRTVKSVHSPMPDFVGSFVIHKEQFRVRYGTENTPEKLAHVAANKALPRDEAQWQMAFFIHPDHGGKGVMQAAGESYLKHCPHIRSRPGMVSGGWLSHNGPSRRCQERLGFRPIGKTPKIWKDHDAISALWMGGGEVKKEDTFLAQTVNLTEEDWEAMREQDREWRAKRRANTSDQSGG